MIKIAEFATEMSEKLTTLVGYPLRADWIVSDDPGFYYYIRNLRPGYPICVMDYHVMPGGRPQLMLVLPYADYQQLDKAECTVEDYLNTAHFSFGYYWGGGSVLGAYWQPLEAEAGIHDTERIKRYLWQMACRTYVHSLGYQPPVTHCTDCPLEAETCSHSYCHQERNWRSEIPELDGRKSLFKALSDRVCEELQFDVYDVLSHTGAKDIVELYAGHRPNSVRIFASQELLNELLYHPEAERDWTELASSLRFVRKKWHDAHIAAEIDPEMQDKHQSCLMFWGNEMPVAPQSVDLEASSDSPTRGKISSWCSGLLDAVLAKFGIARNAFRGR